MRIHSRSIGLDLHANTADFVVGNEFLFFFADIFSSLKYSDGSTFSVQNVSNQMIYDFRFPGHPQGPQSYFKSSRAKNTFISVTLYNFQKHGRAIVIAIAIAIAIVIEINSNSNSN